MAGLGGSAPLTMSVYLSHYHVGSDYSLLCVQIGGAVIGDCWHAEERGKAVAIYSLAPLLGPVIGPVAGAW